MRKICTLMIIITVIALPACSNTEQTESDQINDRYIGSIPISEPSDTDLHLNESSYPVVDFELDVNTDDMTISGIYNDGNCTIDYHVVYNDNEVPQVSYYGCNSKVSNVPVVDSEDIMECLFNTDVYSSYSCDVESPEFWRYVSEVNEGTDVVDISIIPSVSIIEKAFNGFIDLHQNALCVRFDRTGEIFEQHIDIYDIECEHNYAGDLINGFDYYLLREELNGLPIGISEYLHPVISTTVNVGEYYGRFWGISDQSLTSYLSTEHSVIIDVLLYNYCEYAVENGPFEVIPLEGCVKNSIPAIMRVMAQDNTDRASVYYAELIYYPFSADCYSMDYSFEPKLVPVWAVYFYDGDESSEHVSSGVIFLDAVDGRCLSAVL